MGTVSVLTVLAGTVNSGTTVDDLCYSGDIESFNGLSLSLTDFSLLPTEDRINNSLERNIKDYK